MGADREAADVALSVDQAVAALDRRWPGWDVYRLAAGGWRVVVDRERGEGVTRTLLSAALVAAANYNPVPRVPPLPSLPGYKVVRTGDSTLRWHVVTPDGAMACRFGTKRDADAFVEKLHERTLDLRARWHRAFGPLVDAGVEGSDYELDDRVPIP